MSAAASGITLVRRAEIARRLGVHPATVTKMSQTGVIPPKLSGSRFWVWEQVAKKLAGDAPPSTPALSPYQQWKLDSGKA